MDLKEQKFGIEIEMTGITREDAANVLAEYFHSSSVYGGGGYGAYKVSDNENRTWKLVSVDLCQVFGHVLLYER